VLGTCKSLSERIFMDKQLEAALNALPAFTVAVTIFQVKDRRLLVLLKQPMWLKDIQMWMLPDAAYLQGGESLEHCASGVVAAQTGKTSKPTGVATKPRGKLLPGVVSVFYACIPSHDGTLPDRNDLRFRWWDVAGLPDLAGDDRDFIQEALRMLAKSPSDVARLAKDVFTIAELQRDIEEIRHIAGIDKPVQKRTLRRQLDVADWLEDTGRFSSGNRFRPAKLYRVKG